MLEALSKLKHLYEMTNQYKHLYEVSAILAILLLQYVECVYLLQVAAIEVVVYLHQGDLTAATDSYNVAATYVSVSCIAQHTVSSLSLSLSECMVFPALMLRLSWVDYCKHTESVIKSCSTSAVMMYSSGH